MKNEGGVPAEFGHTLVTRALPACRRCGRVGHVAQIDSVDPDQPAGNNCRRAIGQQGDDSPLSPPPAPLPPLPGWTPCAPVAPLPGEVGLAFNSSDHCGRCRRLIRLMEPVYLLDDRTLRCAACFDAADSAIVAQLPPVGDMVTSVLLRRAAQLLDRGAPVLDEAFIIANELRLRAAMLQELRELVDSGPPGEAKVGRVVLRAIGEVRS